MPALRPIEDELLPTRQSLLCRLRELGDDQSWLDFFQTYWRLIYGAGLRAGLSDAEAQDVVQETVLAVHKHMPDFKYNPALGSFKGWLLQLTRWRIIDHLRKRQTQDRLLVHSSGDEPGTSLIESVPSSADEAMTTYWETEWERELLAAAIERVKAKVKPKQFQIFDLYVLKEWPLSKVTQTLGVNLGQVYLAKHRITALIKKQVAALAKGDSFK